MLRLPSEATRGIKKRWHCMVPSVPQIRKCVAGVHSRARGEHGGCLGVGGCLRGSSPRTRGTLRGHGFLPAADRFIPAHAGNTAGVLQTQHSLTVHPRARGEHALIRLRFVAAVGSSPRTRGTLLPWYFDRDCWPFIPAHAGNTGGWFAGLGGCSVHPRARGEHLHRFIAFIRPAGSSPRTRGTHDIPPP